METTTKIKTVEKKITIYVTEDGEEFETEEEAKKYLAKDACKKVECYNSDEFGLALFKFKSKEETELVKYGYLNIFICHFDFKFDYKKENYPLYCIWDRRGNVKKINQNLYNAIIEYDNLKENEDENHK